MTITAWRIVKARHAAAAFSGQGARRFGGRWNSRGVAVVYTAGSASLAALEMLVHLQADELLHSYRLIEVRFSESLVTRIDRRKLSRDWRSDLASDRLRELGDIWVKSLQSAVLQVPSAVIESEFNYMLNPAHLHFSRLNIGKPRQFAFDRRLAR